MKILNFFNSKQIKTSIIGSLGIKFLSALFAFLNSILLARILGLEQFGIYTLAIATIFILAVPVSFGMPNLIIRFISKYEVEANYRAIKGLLIRTNQFVIISTLIVFAISIISYFLWWDSFNSNLVEAIWYGLILLPIVVLNSLKSASLRGLKFILLGQVSNIFLRSFVTFLGVIIYYSLQIELTPAKVIIIQIIATLFSLLVGSLFLTRKLKEKTIGIQPIYKNYEWLKQTIPFSINEGIKISKERVSSFILAIFHGVESVAIFEVALKASSLVSFNLDAINTAIAPYISSIFEKKDFKSLQYILKKSSRIIFITALPIFIVFFFGGEQLITILFGSEFNSAYLPLVILCIGQLVNAIAGSVGVVLVMTGNQAYYTKIIFTSTLLYLALNIPLVLYFNVVGAAINMGLLIIFQNIFFVVYVKKKLKLNTTIF